MQLLSRFRTLVLSHSAVLLAASPLFAVGSATLRGSPASMERQHEVAEAQEYSFLRTPAEVREFVEDGRLVEVAGNADYQVSRGVSYPYARPELVVFVERLAERYRAGCGEPLVVTSLTRPLSSQPRNAHPLSVHPAGMAIDFRISQVAACREWLEETLLSLERDELLDVTRERNPPHYHVAVFPAAYMAYVARQDSAAAALAARTAPPPDSSVAAEDPGAATRRSHGWDSDGLARFTLVVALSVALVFTLARADSGRRHIGF
jgi:hypothetical protein